MYQHYFKIINYMSILITLITLYFVTDIIIDEKNGIKYFLPLKKEVNNKKQNLNNIDNRKYDIEKYILLLSDDQLSIDYLEELTRKNLGYINPKEKVIYIK